ncbi:HlyC/CorC family transporter [Aquirufa nivalisilvae]|uniref:Hemolysin n=1 Tax=Aquirufa nivalisilvae TaxID=2516557 RepID=A0A2S2DTD9_9BACT|nr:hemolysin family protein [Aquirufa nivalisilvae]AWL08280.1 Hemolysin [Aquirufa nivalisilvae]MCZ2478750.1 HlyC/CorC family transporter [Aquirufa nivalisilvae]MCZ2483486.1 HlyC/CorC family transporter [Aquirufa nivalisilvae]TBH75685.1 HlyC/CorC family transporter [Aquirufa nivalisilvae]
MDPDPGLYTTQVAGIIISMIFSAFFSGVEMAFVSCNKLYFELKAKQNILSAKIISNFNQSPSRFIGTMLIGNTLSLVAYGIFMEEFLHHQILQYIPFLQNEILARLLASIVATILILITSEFTPKSIFLINPDVILEFLAILIWIVYALMFPLVWVTVGLSKWFITKVLRLNYSEEKPAFGLTDLNNYLQNLNRKVSTEEEAEVDTKIFHNALEFKQVKVRDCMIPRTEITAIDLEEGIEGLKQVFIESGHSKVLVYKESLEDVLGYCHSLALFKKPKDIQSILTSILIVPEAMPANDLMLKFSKDRKSLALVVDEFGSTSGLVSMEDVMEKIFGEIQDEYDDSEDWVEKKLDENAYLLSGRHEIDYLNEKYDWNFPEGDYETLGGMLISLYEDIPKANEIITLAPFQFQILTSTDARIDTVKMTIVGKISPKEESKIKH